ncbi:MAG: hypothetical protein ACTSWY_12060 [Promethearchaeota archaeon]
MKNSKYKSKNLDENFIEILTPLEYKQLSNTNIEESRQFLFSKREKNSNIYSSLYKQEKLKKKRNQYNNKVIPVLSKNFNNLLGGGFQPGKFYLLYGRYATGKTQFCHNLCVSLINKYKDLKKTVKTLFIDTEDTFRPKRILEIATKGYNLKREIVLKGIDVLKPRSLNMISMLINKIKNEGLKKTIKMILIDSLTNYVRVDLGNKDISNLRIRDSLKKILKNLTEIKNKYNIPIIISSQVTAIPPNTTGFTVRPVMEYILNEFVEESILLSGERKKFAYLVNSCSLPENNIEFMITECGIVDPIL